jgi:hypothetical protein
MTNGYGSLSATRETSFQLSRLIREELQAVTFHKERFDLHFPKHTKQLSSLQLWHIARARTIIKLCAPWCDTRVEGCAESAFA